jgi:lipooligosaccharide transport system permease protein
MTLFSGTFFPLAILPLALQYLALALLPLTHLVAVMRMLTQATVTPVVFLHLAWITAVTTLCCIIAINLMKRRLIV